jgi:hypothetical protein
MTGGRQGRRDDIFEVELKMDFGGIFHLPGLRTGHRDQAWRKGNSANHFRPMRLSSWLMPLRHVHPTYDSSDSNLGTTIDLIPLLLNLFQADLHFCGTCGAARPWMADGKEGMWRCTGKRCQASPVWPLACSSGDVAPRIVGRKSGAFLPPLNFR